jgi:hypothetical protein
MTWRSNLNEGKEDAKEREYKDKANDSLEVVNYLPLLLFDQGLSVMWLLFNRVHDDVQDEVKERSENNWHEKEHHQRRIDYKWHIFESSSCIIHKVRKHYESGGQEEDDHGYAD